MKHPPRQFNDDLAYRMVEEFIAGQDIEGESVVCDTENDLAIKAREEFITGRRDY